MALNLGFQYITGSINIVALYFSPLVHLLTPSNPTCVISMHSTRTGRFALSLLLTPVTCDTAQQCHSWAACGLVSKRHKPPASSALLRRVCQQIELWYLNNQITLQPKIPLCVQLPSGVPWSSSNTFGWYTPLVESGQLFGNVQLN